jgi:hypothetical protein
VSYWDLPNAYHPQPSWLSQPLEPERWLPKLIYSLSNYWVVPFILQCSQKVDLVTTSILLWLLNERDNPTHPSSTMKRSQVDPRPTLSLTHCEYSPSSTRAPTKPWDTDKDNIPTTGHGA